MRALLQELLPHAPQHGLYVAPGIPEDKLRNAVQDYAGTLSEGEVLALYDATLMGGAKDGAVFAADRFVFQNNDLEPAHEIRYADLVAVDEKRKLIGGRKVVLEVNRGRATFTLTMDFSGKAEAAGFVARFLREALLQGAALEMDRDAPRTDAAAVRTALDDLARRGLLTDADHRRLLDALDESV